MHEFSHQNGDIFLLSDDLEPYSAHWTNGDLRLVSNQDDTSIDDDSSPAGRLEIYMHTLLEGDEDTIGAWGTVCGIDFSQTEANVACRQLGFQSATNWMYSSNTV